MLLPDGPATLPVVVAGPFNGSGEISPSLSVVSFELIPAAFSIYVLPAGEAVLGVPCLLMFRLSVLDASADLLLGTRLRPIL